MLESVDNLSQGVLIALTAMWSEVAAFGPNLVGAIVILVVGYIVAKIASAVVRRLLVAVGLDRLAEKTGLAQQLASINVKRNSSAIMGAVVFWIVMLAFLLAASESLGLDRLSETIDSLVRYLPRVLGAVFTLALGLFVATVARDAVRGAASNIGLEYDRTLAQATYVLLVVIVVSLAVGQLELETTLLTVAVAVVMTAAGVAAAIAFGLGSREVAANVLAGAYLRDTYREGSRISVGHVAGEVKAVEALNTVIVTASGEARVPNMLLVRQTVDLPLQEPEPEDASTG